MRLTNNQKTALRKAKPMPFDGLGFGMEAVQIVAESMTVTYVPREHVYQWTPVLDAVVQPSGYSLLVALGREIRGR